jgi:hypothetical protein
VLVDRPARTQHLWRKGLTPMLRGRNTFTGGYHGLYSIAAFSHRKALLDVRVS